MKSLPLWYIYIYIQSWRNKLQSGVKYTLQTSMFRGSTIRRLTSYIILNEMETRCSCSTIKYGIVSYQNPVAERIQLYLLVGRLWQDPSCNRHNPVSRHLSIILEGLLGVQMEHPHRRYTAIHRDLIAWNHLKHETLRCYLFHLPARKFLL